MIHIVNYATGRFLGAQEMQNRQWRELEGEETIRIHSFSRPDVLPILRGLNLPNESEIANTLAVPRGDGLWAWKSVLTYHVFSDIAGDGDIVFYMDSGACPTASFSTIWAHIQAHGSLFVKVSAFECPAKVRGWLGDQMQFRERIADIGGIGFSSKLWTKPFPPAEDNPLGLPQAVVRRLRQKAPAPAVDQTLMESEQVCGGFQGYLKAPAGGQLLCDLLDSTSPWFFDDVVRPGAESRYIDHRHDQSILSLLVNAQSLAYPAFASCIVNELPQVRLHRGYVDAS
ncbi:MAG TPA: hypothetical protein VN700_11660 [Vicinamibacterales bacterium]|nr:hypothetical protein [Vicinamibacterales bacterium]